MYINVLKTTSCCLAQALFVCLTFAEAQAQAAYPTRAVRLVVGYAPGGNADLLSRIVAQKLGEALGQQFVVDNRAGATGTIGSDIVAKATADGYTLLSISSTHVIVPGLFPKLSFDPVKDFAGISRFASVPLVIAVTPSLPTRIKELVARAKAKPGELNYASPGNGSPGHLAGVLFNTVTGTMIEHVPYKSTAQAFTDLISGEVQLMFPTVSAVQPHVKTGKIRALAITSRQRSALAPDLLTAAEAGLPNYEAGTWNAVLAPAHTPQPLINRLNATLVNIMKTPEVRERFIARGAETITDTPAELDQFIAVEIKKWSKVIKDAGVRLD